MCRCGDRPIEGEDTKCIYCQIERSGKPRMLVWNNALGKVEVILPEDCIGLLVPSRKVRAICKGRAY